MALYWKNPDPRSFVNVVPTSAITGEGIPDLLQLIVKLTQSMMGTRLQYSPYPECRCAAGIDLGQLMLAAGMPLAGSQAWQGTTVCDDAICMLVTALSKDQQLQGSYLCCLPATAAAIHACKHAPTYTMHSPKPKPKPLCSVLEVKTMEGLGTSVDVVLVNGTIKEGDKIVVCGLQVGGQYWCRQAGGA